MKKKAISKRTRVLIEALIIRLELLPVPKGIQQNHLMSIWVQDSDEFCGTVGCLGGEALMMVGTPVLESAEVQARKLLGLTVRQGKSLFFVMNWPMVWVKKWTKSNQDLAGQRTVMIGRLKSFLRTGK